MAGEETELQRIERELDILRTRRALYLKWGGPTTDYIVIVAAAIITILLAVVVAQVTKDPLFGMFIVGMVVVMGGLLWLSGSWITGVPHPDRLRRVNIVRSQRRTGALVPLYKVYVYPYRIMDEIDQMIAWREQRQEELKGGRQ